MTRNPTTARCAGDLPRLLLAVTARTVLWSVLLLAVWAMLPAAVDWRVTTVVSESMAPSVRAGDVVAALPVDGASVSAGQVLLVEDPDHDDRRRLHRLERIEADGGLRLRGDANPEPDRTAVRPGAVLGVGVLRFPFVGLPSVWIRNGDLLTLVTAALAAGALAVIARSDRVLRTGEPCRRCGTSRWDLLATPVGVEERSVHAAALPVVTTVLLVALAGSTAGAGFSGATGTAAALGTTESFACLHRDTDGAVLAWDFAEKGGTVVRDSSGSGADGQFVGRAHRADGDCSANPWSVYTSSGSDDFAVTDTAVAAPNTFSLEVWFRGDPSGGGRVFGFGSDRSAASTWRDRHLYVDTAGRLRFGTEESGSQFKFTVSTSARVDDGEWHHAVATFRARSMQLWVDGKLAASRTDAVTLRQYSGHWRTGRQTLAGWPSAGGYGFVGDIDTARVYDRVLDATTIAAHHADGR
jgi:hypothetical protein